MARNLEEAQAFLNRFLNLGAHSRPALTVNERLLTGTFATNAEARADQQVGPGSVVELEGCGSIDANATALHALRAKQLTVLPDSIGQLTQLEDLNLENNLLSALPDSIWQLTRLKMLILSTNQFSILPDSIGQLAGLEVLDLRHNQLSALPNSIGQLTRLKSLLLSTNQLTALPDSIGQLAGLEALNVCKNELSTLPDSFGRLTGLKSLALKDNQLIALPDSIGQLTGLETLNLANNQISTLPDSIGQLVRLDGLSLKSNQLSALPDSIGQLTRLTWFDLSDNQLSALPDSIQELPWLRSLSLKHNYLSKDQLPERLIAEDRAFGYGLELIIPSYPVQRSPRRVQKIIRECVSLNSLTLDQYLWLLASGMDPPPLLEQKQDKYYKQDAASLIKACARLEHCKQSPTHRGWQLLREGIEVGTNLPGVLVDMIIQYHCPSTSPLLRMLAGMHSKGLLPERDSAALQCRLQEEGLTILPYSHDVVLLR